MRASVNKRKEYISETVKAILKNKSLNEFKNIGSAVASGWDYGAGTPRGADIARELYYLERDRRRTPPGPLRRAIEDEIKVLGARRGRVNLGRRAGGIARLGYQGAVSRGAGEISGAANKALDLALGKHLTSIGTEPLGIGDPGGEIGRQQARIT